MDKKIIFDAVVTILMIASATFIAYLALAKNATQLKMISGAVVGLLFVLTEIFFLTNLLQQGKPPDFVIGSMLCMVIPFAFPFMLYFLGKWNILYRTWILDNLQRRIEQRNNQRMLDDFQRRHAQDDKNRQR